MEPQDTHNAKVQMLIVLLPQEEGADRRICFRFLRKNPLKTPATIPVNKSQLINRLGMQVLSALPNVIP